VTKRRRSFGSLRKLSSGRIQARYTGADGVSHVGPVTFTTKGDAESYLATVRTDLVRGVWRPPKDDTQPLTFTLYAENWLAGRQLKPRTVAHYRMLLDRLILPTFGASTLKAITPDAVRRWHIGLGEHRPTLKAHAYALLRSILGSAVDDQLLTVNPARIRGAGTVKRAHQIRPATLDELEKLVGATYPERYRLMILLAAWCAMRYGELVELRRSDVDVRNAVIRIRRAVVRVPGQVIVGQPKSTAGVRDVHVPPHLIPAVKDHLRTYHTGRDGLLFPAGDGVSNLSPNTFYKSFHRARDAAGRSDMTFHDLRHLGGTLAAMSGATLRELQARLGHSTVSAAMVYQHAAQGRDAEIAKALSKMAEGENSH
jgi:integrase